MPGKRVTEDPEDLSVPAATATKKDLESMLGAGKPSRQAEPDAPPNTGRQIAEWAIIIGGALAVALIVRAVLFQAFYIPSGSMEDTLKIHDRVLVNKLAYKFHDIHRGDIVVFKRPPAEENRPEIKDLIKRVIGLPNETVEPCDGKVCVDGHPLTEPYVRGAPLDGLPLKRVTLGPKEYLVLGDNRGDSADGRAFGPIPGSLIVGRAFVKVWPLGSLEWL